MADEDKDDKTTPPTPTEKPEAPKAESTPMVTQAEETPTTEKKGPNWIILTALIGLGVAAAGVAVLKKSV